MRTLIIPVLMFLFIVSACSPRPTPSSIPLAEWESAQRQKFSDVSPQAIIDAAKQVFTLMDGDDFSFKEGGNEHNRNLIAVRSEIESFVFRKEADSWSLYVTLSSNGSDANILLRPMGWGFRTDNSVVFPTRLNAESLLAYEIFWERMNFILGRNRHWPTCEDAKKRVKSNHDPKRYGVSGICGASIEDRKPDSP